MGAGIAAAHARSGIRTAMVDVDDDRLKDGLKRASDVVMSRIKIGRATPAGHGEHARPCSARRPTRRSSPIRDVVIEAVTENEAVKKEVVPEARQGAAGRRDPGQQHLDDLDHAHGRVGAAPRAVRGDALLQPGRPHGAGRGDPRREDQRRDGRHGGRPGQADPQDADRRQGLRRVPGQPRPVPLHERVAPAARRKACRWRRSTRRP